MLKENTAMQRIGLLLLFLDMMVPQQTSKSTPASSSVAPSQGAKTTLTNPNNTMR